MSAKIDFEKLCCDYGLGQLLNKPIVLTGGRSHKLWQIETEKGVFVVKSLLSKFDPKINLDLYRNTQAIAMLILKAKLPVLPALLCNQDIIYQQPNFYMMLFPYVPHHKMKTTQVTSDHCQRLGKFLARLHQLSLDVPSDDVWRYAYDKRQWQDLVLQLQKTESATAPLLEKLLPQVEVCFNSLSCDELDDIVISHRDLDMMNVLWLNDESFVVIDWDLSGRIDASVELLFVALAWGMSGVDELDFDKFDAVVMSYHQQRNLKNTSSDKSVLYLVMQNWLDWVCHQLQFQLSSGLSLAEQVVIANSVRNSLLSFEYIMSLQDQIMSRFRALLV